jgi:hypothetical protein
MLCKHHSLVAALAQQGLPMMIWRPGNHSYRTFYPAVAENLRTIMEYMNLQLSSLDIPLRLRGHADLN